MNNIVCEDVNIRFEDLNKLSDTNANLMIFNIKLEDYKYHISELTSLLHREELQKAEKYHFEKDSNRFIICRALLKCILANRTGIDLYEIKIELDINNKPFLDKNNNIHFNLSHSKDYGIIALSNNNIGIDLEYLHNDFEYMDVMPTVFSLKEIDVVLSKQNKTYQFFKYWTRKEAIVKATGTGINDFLTQIQVLDGYNILATNITEQNQDMRVISFDLNSNYVASVALTNSSVSYNTIQIFNLPNSFKDLILFSQGKYTS
jgi:4'-phosphopantetheinyl transferase